MVPFNNSVNRAQRGRPDSRSLLIDRELWWNNPEIDSPVTDSPYRVPPRYKRDK